MAKIKRTRTTINVTPNPHTNGIGITLFGITALLDEPEAIRLATQIADTIQQNRSQPTDHIE
ncbi:hypothetical protein [Rhodococcus sp. SJ-3]|uniref:hypothetical protein n=1 Tax=Rhodococcus sp. SJ-3 TaxID=3454628 RepID=UPI003F797A4D